MKIYIVAHKNFALPTKEDIYEPLQVGAAINDSINDNWKKDNDGENISDKNLSYNELTGLYWIWKNSKEDIVGLCHYRRFFVTKRGKIQNIIGGRKKGFLAKRYIEKKLCSCDMLIHNKTFFLDGNQKQYLDTQKYPNDLEVLENVLKKNYPEYIDSFYKVMGGKTCHLLNMFITKKSLLDEYCTWLFSVLFEVERELIERGEKSFNRRMGMLGERMLDIWILANNIKTKEVFSINTERRDLVFISR